MLKKKKWKYKLRRHSIMTFIFQSRWNQAVLQTRLTHESSSPPVSLTLSPLSRENKGKRTPTGKARHLSKFMDVLIASYGSCSDSDSDSDSDTLPPKEENRQAPEPLPPPPLPLLNPPNFLGNYSIFGLMLFVCLLRKMEGEKGKERWLLNPF